MANEFIPKFDINPYTLRALAQIAQNYNNYNIEHHVLSTKIDEKR